MHEQLIEEDVKLIGLIETFIEGKSPDPERCEDRFFVDENFAVIADGVTSVLPGSVGGSCSPGCKAAEAVVEAVTKLEPGSTAREAIDAVSDALRKIPRGQEMRCAASVAIYSARHREIWRVGDCKLLIGDIENSSEKLIDSTLSDVRAYILECELHKGASIQALRENDPGREFIIPAIRQQHLFENTRGSRYSYAVVNGDHLDDSFIDIIPVPSDMSELVMASDGYPRLMPTLDETEKELRSIIEKDPLLFREYRSTKSVLPGNNSFDDRAYLRIAV